MSRSIDGAVFGDSNVPFSIILQILSNIRSRRMCT